MHFYSHFPMTWMQHQNHSCQPQLIPAASCDCISFKKTWRKRNPHYSLFSSSSSSSHKDFAILLSCLSSPSSEKNQTDFDFLISGTFLLSIFVLRVVFFPSCWGILLDSSRTGILDTCFFGTLHYVTSPSFALLQGVTSSQKWPPWHEAVGYFILSRKLI